MIYNVVLVSGTQQSESVIHVRKEGLQSLPEQTAQHRWNSGKAKVVMCMERDFFPPWLTRSVYASIVQFFRRKIRLGEKSIYLDAY